MKNNILKEKFEVCEVLEKMVLFSDSRINSDNIPKELYKYEVRDNDDLEGVPSEIAKSVTVNFFGTVISAKPFIQLEPIFSKADGAASYIIIDSDNWNFVGEEMTIKQYMKRYNK